MYDFFAVGHQRRWEVTLSSSEKRLKNSGLNGDSNPDLCDAGAVLHQLSNQANWEQVVMWVDYQPVDVEITSSMCFVAL